MAHGGGNRPAAGDDQHLLAHVFAAHMVECAGHAVHEIGVGGHALGADGAAHPLRQAVAQQAEVRPVALGRGRVAQAGLAPAGQHRADDRMAVVFVQARPFQRGLRPAGALRDGVPGLGMALQRAADDGIEAQAAFGPVAAQALALALAQFAELVVVFGPEGGLAVTDKVERSHGPRFWARAGAGLCPGSD